MSVILYSTHCPRCKVMERKLSEKGIAYEEENDVEKMLSIGIKSAPVLSVDGSMMDFSAALKWLNNYKKEEETA